MYKLGDMFIGYTDGKKEATYVKDFEQYYFDFNKNVERIMEKDKFLLLGKKGTGKSLLAEYLKKKSFKDPTWFCTISSYKEFNFHELIYLKSRDIKPNEYMAIWEWIILIEIAQLCINDQSVNCLAKENLEKFIESNFGDLKLNMNQIIEITKKGSLNGRILHGILGASGGFGQDIKYTQGTFIDYLDSLRTNVIQVLKESSCHYTIVFDELDDKFRNEDIYKSNIISLIKVTDRLNRIFLEENIKCKVILLLRTDIFYVLNDPDLNKIEQDNSIKLDWGNTVKKDSPLFSMTLNKIRQSIPEFLNLNDNDLFNKLFPQTINRREPNEFILGRTYFRPRDLVTYLNFIVEEYPNTTYFGYKGFIDMESKYSEYLLKEIKNELYGHISDTKIHETFTLLKQFKKNEFTYSEINSYYSERKNRYKNIDIDESLKFMFNFSVLGNKWENKQRNKFFYSWAYRENTEINYDQIFVVHLGLRKELIV